MQTFEQILIRALAICAAVIFTMTRLNKQHPAVSAYWLLVFIYWISRSVLQEVT